MGKIKKIVIVGFAIIVVAIIAYMAYTWWFFNYGFPPLYKGDYPIT